MRQHNLLARLQALADVEDSGDVTPDGVSLGSPGSERFKFAPEIRGYSAQLCRHVRSVVAGRRTPVLVGGDHTLSVGSVSGLAAGLRDILGRDPELGLLWVDAHTDVNTPETTVTGNSHGMPVAALLGFGDPEWCGIGGRVPVLNPRNVAFVGLRDVDPPEREFVRRHSMWAASMHDIDRDGLGVVMERAFDVVERARDGFVISFDLDVCDPAIAPGVGTPVRGGFSFREAHLVMELAARRPLLRGIELVEYNPACDTSGATAELGVALLESALGKCIL